MHGQVDNTYSFSPLRESWPIILPGLGTSNCIHQLDSTVGATVGRLLCMFESRRDSSPFRGLPYTAVTKSGHLKPTSQESASSNKKHQHPK